MEPFKNLKKAVDILPRKMHLSIYTQFFPSQFADPEAFPWILLKTFSLEEVVVGATCHSNSHAEGEL